MKPEIMNGDRQLTKPDPMADATPEWRQVMREAEKLATASLTPSHLKVQMPPNKPENEAARRGAWNQTIANCLLVANQAKKWGADVFAVAGETYVVGNKLGYQGKLIAAIVNSRGGLSAPLSVIYSTGSGDNFAAVLYGKRNGEVPQEAFDLLAEYADKSDQKANRELAKLGVLTVRIAVSQAKTDNKMWRTDPEQKLFYTGATKWARRHAPELMLGLLSDDDLDYIKQQERSPRTETQQQIEQLLSPTLDTLPVNVTGVTPKQFTPETADVDLDPPLNSPNEAKIDSAEHTESPSPFGPLSPEEWVAHTITAIPVYSAKASVTKEGERIRDKVLAVAGELHPDLIEKIQAEFKAKNWPATLFG